MRGRLRANSTPRGSSEDASKQTALKLHQNRCAVQRDVVTATVNKTLFSLVLEQEAVLLGLGLPYFSPEILSRIEAVSGDAHLYSNELFKTLEQQRKIVCALLSLRFATTTQSVPGATHVYSNIPASPSMVANSYALSIQNPQMIPLAGSGKKRRRVGSIGLGGVTSPSDGDEMSSPAGSDTSSAHIFHAAHPSTSSVASGVTEINFDDVATVSVESTKPFPTPAVAPSLSLLQKLTAMANRAKKINA